MGRIFGLRETPEEMLKRLKQQTEERKVRERETFEMIKPYLLSFLDEQHIGENPEHEENIHKLNEKIIQLEKRVEEQQKIIETLQLQINGYG